MCAAFAKISSQAPIQVFYNDAGMNRLTVALIVAGLFVGASMLSLSTMEPRLLGVPVRFAGVGEGVDDLQVFDSASFVRAMFE